MAIFSYKKRACSSVFIEADGNVTDTLPTTPVMIEMKLEVPKSYNDWATISFIFPNQDIDTTNNTPMKDRVIDIIRLELPVCDVNESSLKNNGNSYTINIGIEPKAKSADLEEHRKSLAKIFCEKMYMQHRKKFATPQPQPQNPQPAPAPQNPQPQNPQPAPAPAPQNPQPQNPQPQQQQNPQPAQPAPEKLKPGCNPTGMVLTQLSQKASVDEHNRIRRLCGMPELQFELDDGSIYPPSI